MEGYIVGIIIVAAGLFVAWILRPITASVYIPHGTQHYVDMYQPRIQIHRQESSMTEFNHQYEGKRSTKAPEYTSVTRAGRLEMVFMDGTFADYPISETSALSSREGRQHNNIGSGITHWHKSWTPNYTVKDTRILIHTPLSTTTIMLDKVAVHVIVWDESREDADK